MSFIISGWYRLYPIGKVFPAAASDRLSSEERAEYRAITYKWYSQYYQTAIFRENVPTVQQISDFKALHAAEIPDVPTLLFVSEDEENFGAMLGENGLDKWKTIHQNYIAGLTDAKLVQLSCGHYVHVEAPEQISGEIRSFTERLKN